MSRATKEQWETIKYFKPEEFDSPDLAGSGVNMDYAFLVKLDHIRALIGKMIVSSGFRTVAHNNEVGGVSGSEHLMGMGADIVAITSRQRYSIVQAALGVGINRIGIGKTFVHLGMDENLPTHVIWLYS